MKTPGQKPGMDTARGLEEGQLWGGRAGGRTPASGPSRRQAVQERPSWEATARSPCLFTRNPRGKPEDLALSRLKKKALRCQRRGCSPGISGFSSSQSGMFEVKRRPRISPLCRRPGPVVPGRPGFSSPPFSLLTFVLRVTFSVG